MPKMNVSYFNADEFENEKEYTTDAEKVIAYIDMVDAVKSGKWCMVGVENKYFIVDNLSQLVQK